MTEGDSPQPVETEGSVGLSDSHEQNGELEQGRTVDLGSSVEQSGTGESGENGQRVEEGGGTGSGEVVVERFIPENEANAGPGESTEVNGLSSSASQESNQQDAPDTNGSAAQYAQTDQTTVQSQTNGSQSDSNSDDAGHSEAAAPSSEEPSPENARRRVKVYELPEGAAEWEAKGTGNVECVWVEDQGAMCLVVRSEEHGDLLMNAKIRGGQDIYNRQQETLIVWVEPTKMDLALSFQEAAGCDEIWAQIREVQKGLQSENENGDLEPGIGDENAADAHWDANKGGERPDDLSASNLGENRGGQSSVDLPEPTISNLPAIEVAVQKMSRVMYMRDLLIAAVTENGWLERLLETFQECEDLEATEDIYVLSSAMRSIIALNDTSIFEKILRDDLFSKVVGVLEYDREWPNMNAQYREHLENKVRFKQVIPIQNEEIKTKIIQTYRVQFLKDVVLARHMDDGTFSTLNSLAFFNQVDVVGYMQQDEAYLKELFKLVNFEGRGGGGLGLLGAVGGGGGAWVGGGAEGKRERKKDAVKFLQELCHISKNLQSMSRGSFFRALAQHGLFNAFTSILSDPDLDIRISGAAIITNVLDHDPPMLRSFILAQHKKDGTSLVRLMIERLIEDPNDGLRDQLADLLQKLLNTSGADEGGPGLGGGAGVGGVGGGGVGRADPDAEEFLQVFYDSYIEGLLVPVVGLDGGVALVELEDGQVVYPLPTTQTKPDVYNFVMEFISFAVRHHGFRAKYTMLGKRDILSKVALLLKAKDTYLRLTALRVIRTCVGTKDEFYTRHLIKIDALEKVLGCLKDTKGKYNMINSAVLEMFEFIRKENIKNLVAHVVTQHRELIQNVGYADTFQNLIRRHEQNEDASAGGSGDGQSATPQPAKPRDGWEKSADDESYFNTAEDDEDENAPASAGSGTSSSSTSSTSSANGDASPRRNAVEFVPASPTGSPLPSPLVDYPDEDEDDLAGVIARKAKSPSPSPGVGTREGVGGVKVPTLKRVGSGSRRGAVGGSAAAAGKIGEVNEGWLKLSGKSGGSSGSG
ncbi:Platinum sensitivity protein, partial [Rhizophlyctis rosea]